MRDRRRQRHQHAEAAELEQADVVAAHRDRRQRLRAELAGHQRVRRHHAGGREVADDQRTGEAQDGGTVRRGVAHA
jgi:hypothetical protein